MHSEKTPHPAHTAPALAQQLRSLSRNAQPCPSVPMAALAIQSSRVSVKAINAGAKGVCAVPRPVSRPVSWSAVICAHCYGLQSALKWRLAALIIATRSATLAGGFLCCVGIASAGGRAAAAPPPPHQLLVAANGLASVFSRARQWPIHSQSNHKRSPASDAHCNAPTMQAQARSVAARVASPVKEEWQLTQFTCASLCAFRRLLVFRLCLIVLTTQLNALAFFPVLSSSRSSHKSLPTPTPTPTLHPNPNPKPPNQTLITQPTRSTAPASPTSSPARRCARSSPSWTTARASRRCGASTPTCGRCRRTAGVRRCVCGCCCALCVLSPYEHTAFYTCSTPLL